MAKRPHLKLNTKKQKDAIETLKYNYGFGDDAESNKKPFNSILLVRALKRCLTNLKNDQANRIRERNITIEIPEHIEYINIIFQSQFDLLGYYEKWYADFGLLGIKFSKFNHQILFAVTDKTLFDRFIKNIENFILSETTDTIFDYSGKVKYIREFKLLTTSDIIKYTEHGKLMNLLLADFPIDDESAKEIYNALVKYLINNNIEYRLIENSKTLEVYDIPEEMTREIAQNFDVVVSITSSLATVIGPTKFNLPERSYGFQIQNSNEELPIIAIIDTGISKTTPLSSIIINDDSFNITSTSPFIDNADSGSGHGTGVAALAALGRKAYTSKYTGNLKADAKLLSIKILDSTSGFLSEKSVLDLLVKAKQKYPSLKIFVLTTCYKVNKLNNEDYSTYSLELDKFSHTNDCLIVICTANNYEASIANTHYDLHYFNSEATNICSPAESRNNLVVGAAADSLRQGAFQGISTSKEYPAIFSRKSHVDLKSLYPINKINKFYFRPDVIECGGDFEQYGKNILTGNKATMEILSAKQSEGFYSNVGTSFSTPLVANIAAQIQKLYPSLKSQSIKALIINGASLNMIRFPKQLELLRNKVAGHGLVDPEKSTFSNDNLITFIIEESINPEELKIYPLNFPQYLTKTNLGKKNGVLKISATLCFSFLPVPNHQLAYCPIHIGFGIFKNQTGKEIQSIEDDEKGVKSKIKSTLGWSQTARHIKKPIPYSNSQKITFLVNVDELLNEKNTFKLAVNCRINPQLLSGADDKYKVEHLFSIAISIEENLKQTKLTNQLYLEMESVNIVENIVEIDLEAEAISEI